MNDQTQSNIAARIRPFPLCSGMSDEEVETFARHLQVAHYHAGSILYTEGKKDPDDLFIVLSGEVEISSPNRFVEEGSPLQVRLGTGDVLGIIGFVSDEPHVGTAKAIEDSTLATLSRREFNHLCEKHPPIAIALLKFLVTALDHFTTRLLDQYKASMAFMYGAVKK